MINFGEHVTIFGMSGSGKSTLTRKIGDLFPRKIIFDRLKEWNHIEAIRVKDYHEFKTQYKLLYLLNSFTLVYEPHGGLDHDFLLEEVNQIISLVYQVESVNSQGIGIIFEEVWLYAPLHSIPPWIQETMLTGRHHNISVISNSQRPADVSKILVSQSRHLFVGQYYEFRDKKYYEDTFGRIPELAQSPPKYSFLWFKTGEPPRLITN